MQQASHKQMLIYVDKWWQNLIFSAIPKGSKPASSTLSTNNCHCQVTIKTSVWSHHYWEFVTF